MKQSLLVVAALLAGFAGGVLGTQMVLARHDKGPAQSIRARGFELVNESGQTISYWGVDKAGNAVLAFASHWPVASGGPNDPTGRPPQPLDNPDNQRTAIGVIDDSPFLMLRGPDGKTRVRLYLSMYAKPFLLMEDETGPRLLLGVQQSDTPGPQDNDWALDFGPSRAHIGMHTEVVDGQTYVRGNFRVQQDRVKYPYNQRK